MGEIGRALRWLASWTLLRDRHALRLVLWLFTRPRLAVGLFALGAGSVLLSQVLGERYPCGVCTAAWIGVLLAVFVPAMAVVFAIAHMVLRAVLFNAVGLVALAFVGLERQIRRRLS